MLIPKTTRKFIPISKETAGETRRISNVFRLSARRIEQSVVKKGKRKPVNRIRDKILFDCKLRGFVNLFFFHFFFSISNTRLLICRVERASNATIRACMIWFQRDESLFQAAPYGTTWATFNRKLDIGGHSPPWALSIDRGLHDNEDQLRRTAWSGGETAMLLRTNR